MISPPEEERGNLVKFGHVVLGYADRQTHTDTFISHNTVHPDRGRVTVYGPFHWRDRRRFPNGSIRKISDV